MIVPARKLSINSAERHSDATLSHVASDDYDGSS